MIYTVTFNPALDYIVHLDQLNSGETNRSRGEELYYGGKGINVSAVLTSLGVANVSLGFIAGFTGLALEKGVKELGIKTDFIFLPEGFSRINVKIKSTAETEINAQGPEISEEAVKLLVKKLDRLKSGDILILAGSIPSTLPEDIYETILQRLQGRGIRFVVDATKNLLLNVLKYKPFLVKPNTAELGELFGKVLNSEDEILEHAQKLQKMGAKNVLVSMAKDGAILVTENGEHYKIGVPNGQVRNTVGAGDSMVAGFLAGYLKTGDYSYALKMGTAAGSATAFNHGLATKAEVLNLFKNL